MDKVPYTNTSKYTDYIGGVMIPPNDTREVDASLIPGNKPRLADASASTTSTHIVDVLLTQSAAEIIAAVPTLAREDLEKLGELEQSGAARKEVLGAIAVQLLTLANAEQEAAKTSSQAASQPQTAEPVASQASEAVQQTDSQGEASQQAAAVEQAASEQPAA